MAALASEGAQIGHVAATGRTLRERGLGCSGAKGVRTQGDRLMGRDGVGEPGEERGIAQA